MYFRTLIRRGLPLAFLIASTVFCLSAARGDDAKPFLHSLFTNNMVLQRGVSDPVWGWTTPGAQVSLAIDGKTAKAVAAADGKWIAKLPPLPVGGPYTLTVAGPQNVTLNNVMVGDVWICSGQSNMTFGIGGALNGTAEIAAANYPNLRLFTVGTTIGLEPHALVSGQWDVCTPATVGNGGWNGFSAVAYFFGQDLEQAVNVPIGLIHTSWPGTLAQAWTSREALMDKMPEFGLPISMVDADLSETGTFDQRMADWYTKNDPGIGANWQDPSLDDSSWTPITLPGYFQNAGIPELSGINGIVWFRKSLDVPAADAGKAAVLHLKADDNDTVWLNGVQIGATRGANNARSYPIAVGALKPTGNVLAVRILDTGGMGGVIGDPTDLSLEVPGAQNVALAGQWQAKLGIRLTDATPVPRDFLNNPNNPTVLYNGMIAPLVPFAIKGAIWYQGESNASSAHQYQTLLPTMITDWRTRFNVGNFPFLIVQLANIGQPPGQPGNSNWAELREAQLLTAERLPNTGIAIADDIGDPNDIHPKNKEEVGRRLSLVAQALAYGQKVEYAGPVYENMSIEGGTIRLHFRHIGGGLVVKGGDKLTGFAIAGKDGNFVWADAKIDGGTVLVSSPAVPAPTAVRYAWADNPVCDLYNQAGLPATSFRTDMPTPTPMPALPANAGRNLALGKPYSTSDGNIYGWDTGLTDGSWEPGPPTCWASGGNPTFPKTATIDLKTTARVGLVRLGVPPYGSTKTIQVSVSTDGTNFTQVGSYMFTLGKEERHIYQFSPMAARFVRLTYVDHYDSGVNYSPTNSFTTECEVYAPTK